VWTDALLAECRNEAGVVFCKMSAEAQRAIAAVRAIGATDIMCSDWGYIGPASSAPSSGNTYRIHPDWKPPEPKPATKFVRVVPRFDGSGACYIVNDEEMLLTDAPNMPTFRGYEYAGHPVMPELIFDFHTFEDLSCRKLRIPDAVLFEVQS
jgi:hypothetical protein